MLCQLLGTLLLPGAALARAPDDPFIAGAICHSGDAAPAQDQAPGQHSLDCLLCPLCLAGSLHALSPTPSVVPEPVRTTDAVELSPKRARLSVDLFRPVGQARAPPASV